MLSIKIKSIYYKLKFKSTKKVVNYSLNCVCVYVLYYYLNLIHFDVRNQ